VNFTVATLASMACGAAMMASAAPPRGFEANLGQSDQRARFVERAGSGTLFFTQDEVVLSGPSILRLKLRGASGGVRLRGGDPLAGASNYLIGNDARRWITDVPRYGKVRYEGVYSGVDLTFYEGSQGLEYDFTLMPGADARQIRLAISGARTITLGTDGSLRLTLANEEVRMLKPVAYQEVRGHRAAVEAEFRVNQAEVGFRIGPYDRSRPLIIDPVLTYSTYLGGSANDAAAGIAIDLLGNAYVIGSTMSADFPVVNGDQTTNHGAQNIFVTKMSADGSTTVYSTYLGGSGTDSGQGIAVDVAGYACITGATTSLDFPTASALQAALAGAQNGFVAKLNAKGSGLVYSTYLGGSGTDQGYAAASDSAGNCTVAGSTTSTNFPTFLPMQGTLKGGSDGFVARINPVGSAFLYSTYLGGSGNDTVRGVALDASENAYLTGDTASADFPVVGAFQPVPGGGSDAFVTKLNAAGSSLAYSTYLGGAANDTGRAITVDAAGNAYVTGDTSSVNFPLSNALQTALSGGSDAFVTQLNSTGSALGYSTYLGGSGNDLGFGVAVDGSGNAYVAGETASANFPLANALQGALGGGRDAFVAEIIAGGSALAYSTYLGGSGDDVATGLAVDAGGNAAAAGWTASTNFPTVAAVQSSLAGGQDAFLLKIGFPQNVVPVVTFSAASLTFGNQFAGTRSSAQVLTLTNSGYAPLSISSLGVSGDFLQTNNCGSTLSAGASCTINVTFAPAMGGARTGAVTITDNAGGSPHIVGLMGTAVAPVPQIGLSWSPVDVAPRGPGFTLKVYGSGFLPGAVVNWNGSARQTAFVSSTQLNAAILGTDIAIAGSASITVTNPVQFGPSLVNRSLFLTGVGNGVTASQWPQANLILYNRQDANQCDQVHSVRPDGTGDLCLTCGATGFGGGIAFHNGKLSPDGKWLLMQVTIAASSGCASPDGAPGTGNNQEIWLASYPNLSATQLRVSPACVTGRCQNLIPIWHPRQSQVAFGNRQAPCVNPGPPACAMKMAIANVSFPSGVPTLGKTTIVDVAGATPGIVEPWSWKADGSQIYYSGEDATHPYPSLTVNSLALNNGAVTVLTPYSGANVWNEFPAPAPNGSGLFFSSSRTSPSECLIPGCPSPLFALDELQFMNLDGSKPTALTGLNVSGSADYGGGTPMAANGITLSSSGTQGLINEEIPGAPKWITMTSVVWPPNGVSNTAQFAIANPVAGFAFGSTNSSVAGVPVFVATGDFNGDGKLDVISANGAANSISVLIGNGDGTFGGHKEFTVLDPVGLTTGDFNGDGKLDIAAATSSGVSVLLGNGDGTFGKHQDFTAGHGLHAVAVGDFNLDGKLDLAVTNGTDGTVSILLGNGDGTFQKHADYSAGANPVAVAVADLNADGAPDLAVVNGSSVSVLFGNANGTMRSPIPLATGMGSSSVAVGDFNGDGKLDLAVTNSTDNTVSVLVGSGHGAFQNHIDYATGVGPSAVAVADFNADGKPDLAVTGATVSVLEGNGDGTFRARQDFGPSGSSLTAADFNRDGLADLALTNASGSVTALIGTSARPGMLTLSPSAIYGGLKTTLNTVTLNAAAPVGGVSVSLMSSNPAVGAAPASVTVAAGATVSPDFAITTNAVASSTPVTISATLGSATANATLTVAPAVLYGISLSPSSTKGGAATLNNAVSLAGNAPPGGATVILSSSNPAVAALPGSVTIAPNQAVSAAFTITTSAVTQATAVTITASFGGVKKTAQLIVNP